MVDGRYTIYIDTPFGRKPGTVVLRTEGDSVFGHIDAPVIGEQETEAKLDGNTFETEGTFKIRFIGKVSYKLRGVVEGDKLTIVIESSKGNFELTGERE